MTAKEAREILDLMINLDHKKPVPNRDLVLEAIQMAIKALEAQELNCDGCVYQDRSVRKPFVDPCIWCKRNCIDHWKGKK